MSWLSPAELDDMRDDVLAMLPDVCDILRAAPERDDEGEVTILWSAKSKAVPCRLDYTKGRESVTGAAVQPYAHAILTLPWYAVLATTDRVRIGADVYAVKAVNKGQSWAVAVRAEVEAVL